MGLRLRGPAPSGLGGKYQSRLADFLSSDSGGSVNTVTRPAFKSSDQTRVPPGSAPSALAMPSGIVTRTDDASFRTSIMGDLKIPGIDSPITLTDGLIHNYALRVGIPIGYRLKYLRENSLRRGYRGLRELASSAETMAAMKVDEGRAAEGRRIAATPGAVEQVKEGVFLVKSQSGPGRYRVTVTPRAVECDCPDFVKRTLPCKHAASVRFYLEKQTTLPSGEVLSEKVPITYSQAWGAYNRAQMEEVRLFDILLADILADLPEPEQVMGRPRTPLRDELFCAVQKVYSQLSCRRVRSLFGFAAERGQLPKVPGYTVTSHALNREDATQVLHDLITRSAIPLAAVEQGFAPDSTGIRTTFFGAWRQAKYGEQRDHLWLKVHAFAGVKTHIIVRASVTGKDVQDNTQFELLVRAASAAGIKLKQVFGDKAFSARANYALAEEIGFDLYVPFKANATAHVTTKKGGVHGRDAHSLLWRKAFHFFQMHRDEFEAKYHARSNIESVFSALKRKFGETLRSRKPTAQVNELLAKILAYNLTVVIHEIFEHGIIPDFLRNPEAAGVPCLESSEAVQEVANVKTS